MQSGRACCNGHGVPSLDAEHLTRRRGELAEHQGGGIGRRRLEVLPRRGERPLERAGQRQAADPRLERLQAAAVVLCAHRSWRQQGLRGPDDQPQREQAFALGAAHRFRDQRDELVFRRGHATSRCTAAATWSGKISSRQRWCPSGQRSVPIAEQGRQSRSSLSTSACLVYGKKPNGSKVGPNNATTRVPTPVAMCITPVSPETSTVARARHAPVSCSANSPAALCTPAPSAPASCRSPAPPTATSPYPMPRSCSASALQWRSGQRLVACAAPGASAAKGCPSSPRSLSQRAIRSRAGGARKKSGGPPSGCTSSARAASK